MIIYSCNRDTRTADVAADMVIPFLYDIPPESGIIKQLQSLPEPAAFVVPLPLRAAKSILTHYGIPFGSIVEQLPSDEKQTAVQETETSVETQFPPRWYPVIDDDRCIGCLECVNFCIFGVYAIGQNDKPVVDKPDACKDGCPACARVCPGKAIMFPLCEERQIAGYDDAGESELAALSGFVDAL
ncbi:MAG: 4Fe-4S dicluster domain-containing protein [Planctomycetaceae bacterium]|jgi:NAD-dependent dihydropyrimidine dehydrogenase PreA subunit|nr:4Fe-4S dicluster domain-containing protein [Planctomycetaceae bacterium]